MALNKSMQGSKVGPFTTRIYTAKVRRFCESLGDLNPAFVDPIFAEQSSYGRCVAPPTFINTLREGKTQLLVGLLGVEMPKLLHGHEEIVAYAPLFVGDDISYVLSIPEVGSKRTRAFGEMDYFVVQLDVQNEANQAVATVRQSFFVEH